MKNSITIILFLVCFYTEAQNKFTIKSTKSTIEVTFKNYYIVDKSSPKTSNFVLNKKDLSALFAYISSNKGETNTKLKTINSNTTLNLYVYTEENYCELYFGVEGEDYEIMSHSLSLNEAKKLLIFKNKK